MQTSKRIHVLSIIIAALFCVICPAIGYLKIGLPPVVIIGSSAILAYFFWYRTYLKSPTEPNVILPIFILTVAGLQIHITEEYLSGFRPGHEPLI